MLIKIRYLSKHRHYFPSLFKLDELLTSVRNDDTTASFLGRI